VSALIAPPKRVEQATFFKRGRQARHFDRRRSRLNTELFGFLGDLDQFFRPVNVTTQVSLSEAGWTTLGSSAAIVDTCDPAARHQRP